MASDIAMNGSAASHVVEVVDVTKSFKQNVVLDHVTFSVKQGETVCVIGPSGAGKSTLLRCIIHLQKPDAGAIFLDGELIGYREHRGGLVELNKRVIARQRSRMGMVFQSFDLFSHMTLLENVMEAPVHVLGEKKQVVQARARELLDRVGLADKASSYPGALSGGQQQRGAIARALAMKPRVLLFDEPTSALDPESIGGVLATMEELARESMTMIVVTHELSFARKAASRVVFMENGRVLQDDTVDRVLVDPQHERVKRFLASAL
jgi:polar amino acid transport system ATP-binding protein